MRASSTKFSVLPHDLSTASLMLYHIFHVIVGQLQNTAPYKKLQLVKKEPCRWVCTLSLDATFSCIMASNKSYADGIALCHLMLHSTASWLPTRHGANDTFTFCSRHGAKTIAVCVMTAALRRWPRTPLSNWFNSKSKRPSRCHFYAFHHHTMLAFAILMMLQAVLFVVTPCLSTLFTLCQVSQCLSIPIARCSLHSHCRTPCYSQYAIDTHSTQFYSMLFRQYSNDATMHSVRKTC